MSNKAVFKTLGEFLFPEKDKLLVIPNYQRGYKWAVKENDDQSAVEKLLDNLLDAYDTGINQEYFLQGITVAEEKNQVILIDGQQRTTTLYLLLWCTGELNGLKLKYDVRKKSKEFINKLENKDFHLFDTDEKKDNQDVFYFKKAIHQINAKLNARKSTDNLNGELKKDFTEFLLKKVTILYIIIDKDKAAKTFTMMNGSKAMMLDEELVKAEILRTISLPEISSRHISNSIKDNLEVLKEIISIDWETNALRSRYAREWDKWLYWWNRKGVIEYFGIEKPLGYLLGFFLKDKNKNKNLFERYRNLINDEKIDKKQYTKKIFKALRDLQKSFEDLYNNPEVYNYLKMSLICSSDINDRYDIIQYFIDHRFDCKKGILFSEYAKWRLLGARHLEILDKEENQSKNEKALLALDLLSANDVYNNKEAKGLAYKQLLKLNVEQDNKLGRKFDFTIWNDRSLEHIHPKSKAYFINEEGIMIRGDNQQLSNNEKNEINKNIKKNKWLHYDNKEDDYSVHCIGNLVMLYGNNNSEFGAKSFIDKKNTYFNINPEKRFKSRHLLHSISVFSKSIWHKEEIKKEKDSFIKRFKDDYKIRERT